MTTPRWASALVAAAAFSVAGAGVVVDVTGAARRAEARDALPVVLRVAPPPLAPEEPPGADSGQGDPFGVLPTVPVPTLGPGRHLRATEELLGRTRVRSAALDEAYRGLLGGRPLTGSLVAAWGDGPDSLVVVGADHPPGRSSLTLDALVTGLMSGSDGAAGPTTSAPAGPLGGDVACGPLRVQPGVAGSYCVWVDSDVFAYLLVPGSGRAVDLVLPAREALQR